MSAVTTALTKDQIQFFAKFLKEHSGYHLTDDKAYLLESRLKTVISVDNLPDVNAIIQTLVRDPMGKVAEHVVEVMTINETFFFRDQSPFEAFEKEILPVLAERGKTRPIRIWSAACSTGQEPYSLAIIIEEHRGKYPHLQYEIVASDINNRILAKARQGLFSDLEVNRGLPPKYRDKYFTKDGSQWSINDTIRKHINFKYHNLKADYIGLGSFDLVLLRNVLIYFDATLKENILSKIEKVMRKDGYLMLGAAEGIHDPKHYFVRCPRTKNTYRHRETVASEAAAK